MKWLLPFVLLAYASVVTPCGPDVALDRPEAAVDTGISARAVASGDGQVFDPVSHVWRLSRAQLARPRAVPVSCPTCSVANWYGDRQNVTGCANDGATCGQSATCGAGGAGPCVHLCRILVGRYGTPFPSFQGTDSPTITFLSDEDPDDPCTLSPWVSSGTPENFSIPKVQGALGATYLSSATIGTYAAQVRCTNGSPPCGSPGYTLPAIHVAGVDWSTACGGASCVGATVHDTTRGAQAWIVADQGGGTATISQQFVLPVTPAGPLLPFQSGDLITVGRPTRWFPVVVESRSSLASFAVNEMAFGSPAGGSPLIKISGDCNECLFEASTDVTFQLSGQQITSIVTSGFGANHSYQFGAWWALGGAYLYDTWFADQSALDGDIQLYGYTVFQGPHVTIGATYLANPNQTEHVVGQVTVFVYHNPFYGTFAIWGPGALSATQGTRFGVQRSDGILWSNVLFLTGQNTLDQMTTGCAFQPDAGPGPDAGLSMGAITCGIPITAQNIDSAPNGGLSSAYGQSTGSSYFSE